jgi:hypothetical protein
MELQKWQNPRVGGGSEENTLLRELCVAIDVHLSSVELGGGNNALDAPEIA